MLFRRPTLRFPSPAPKNFHEEAPAGEQELGAHWLNWPLRCRPRDPATRERATTLVAAIGLTKRLVQGLGAGTHI